jgi:hypothetical protein
LAKATHLKWQGAVAAAEAERAAVAMRTVKLR